VAAITGRSADDWKLGQVADVDLHWPDITTFDADCGKTSTCGARKSSVGGMTPTIQVPAM
jgi:hypothetical protein